MSVCLCIRLHLVPGFVCLVTAPPSRRAVLARREKKKPGWLDYTVQDSGTRCHDIDDTTRVTPPLFLCHLAAKRSVWGPTLYISLLPPSFSGMWWGAVIYKKWLGGNSSNMICVGAHKTSPSVTLKEWNGRGHVDSAPCVALQGS